MEIVYIGDNLNETLNYVFWGKRENILIYCLQKKKYAEYYALNKSKRCLAWLLFCFTFPNVLDVLSSWNDLTFQALSNKYFHFWKSMQSNRGHLCSSIYNIVPIDSVREKLEPWSDCVNVQADLVLSFPALHTAYLWYEGRAKSSVTNRLSLFYARYILKCFTALEWCVE